MKRFSGFIRYGENHFEKPEECFTPDHAFTSLHASPSPRSTEPLVRSDLAYVDSTRITVGTEERVAVITLGVVSIAELFLEFLF